MSNFDQVNKENRNDQNDYIIFAKTHAKKKKKREPINFNKTDNKIPDKEEQVEVSESKCQLQEQSLVQ